MPVPHDQLYQQAKRVARKNAVRFVQMLLRSASRSYELPEGTTVVIAPHQDDETLGCGGLIARKRSEGLPVHVIFITDGSASHPGHGRLGPPAIARLRQTEALRALSLLGVERTAVHFLNEPDGTLNCLAPDRREHIVARLEKLLRTLSPGEVFVPCHPDGSSEHDATFEFVVDALSRTGQPCLLWQYPVWAWWNPLLLLRSWISADECRRQPAEDYLHAKRQAMASYESQIAPLPPDTTPALPLELIETFQAGTEYFFRSPVPARRPLPEI